MNKIWKECDNCFGYDEEFSDCCNVEYDGRCSDCGKFASTHKCDHCWGDGGSYLEIGQIGTMVTDIFNNDFSEDQVALIKRTGGRSENWMYPHYYHNSIKIIEIVDDYDIIVVIGENGRKRFKINIQDFYE